ncbi:hypothetical protein BDY24DRAFT_415708 [Mrakia frigida]|uniref:uncharacterized protein n=1 Tax=Mrakia frigida TaxID=29902 RepID=UPI003FCBF16E
MPPRPSSSSLENSGPAKKLKADDPLPDREDKTFNHEKADIVLRAPPHPNASNRAHVLFPLRSLVLRGASSVFDDLLDIPQPKGSPPNPIINFTEDADTVRRFLILIDPATTFGPLPTNFPLYQLKDLFLLAVKYQVDGLASELERQLMSHAWRKADLDLFEFALDHELWGVLGRALMTLEKPIKLSSFPKPLRRKMGDELWDGIVDCYDGTSLVHVAELMKRLGHSAGLKFGCKGKVFHEEQTLSLATFDNIRRYSAPPSSLPRTYPSSVPLVNLKVVAFNSSSL